jgi:hypothetical protein
MNSFHSVVSSSFCNVPTKSDCGVRINYALSLAANYSCSKPRSSQRNIIRRANRLHVTGENRRIDLTLKHEYIVSIWFHPPTPVPLPRLSADISGQPTPTVLHE